jgi:hypothetical protein
VHDQAHDLEKDPVWRDQGVGAAPVLQDFAVGIAGTCEVEVD